MISIIIPTYQEAAVIGLLIKYLLQHGNNNNLEVIVVDGGSSDDTKNIAANAGANALVSPQKGRAAQMNYGASLAKGDVLFFVHADTFPPKTFVSDINAAIKDGFDFGRYRTKFDSKKFILKLNAFFTRFDLFVCYGGDQTLFIKKSLFQEINGFDNSMRIMEDYDITVRAKQKGTYKIIPKNALISARKYETNSWFEVQKANYTIVQMFKKGASQEAMVDKYKNMLNYR